MRGNYVVEDTQTMHKSNLWFQWLCGFMHDRLCSFYIITNCQIYFHVPMKMVKTRTVPSCAKNSYMSHVKKPTQFSCNYRHGWCLEESLSGNDVLQNFMKFGKLNSPETFDREKFIKYFISLGLDLRLSNKENEKINLCGNQETSCQKKGCLFKSINWFLHSVEYEIVFKCVV